MKTLSVKIFADGADLSGMIEMNKDPLIQGFTTNPTLMRKAGVTDYQKFAKSVLQAIPDKPISFEVMSDEYHEILRQARIMALWGPKVYVKIPITTTDGEYTRDILYHLSKEGIKVNITAVMTMEQVATAISVMKHTTPAYISIFAGRIADTGVDPIPIIQEAAVLAGKYDYEVIWASPREVLNIFQANDAGCPVITVTNDLLKKLNLIGKDLTEYSLETVQMFYNDATKAGYTL